ncbi:chalcone isomerase family protein [Celerinatantimonas sp. YJH-8]|uniref:chalcone isomerase family protein n=1 Tax=Celerinatantimonas sp. YJH-8 TaxID=3228714 RepID=UPI0038C8EFBB
MIAAIWLAMATASSTLEHTCVKPMDQQLLGKVTIKRWWVDIYQARLYQSNGPQAAQQARPGTRMQMTYFRDIKHQDLIKQTRKEWQKLAVGNKFPVEQWLNKLTNMWPDVKTGDCMEMRVASDHSAQFYYGEQKIGAITDPQFSRVFLSIWLSDENHYPKMRHELLGKLTR